MMQELVGLLWPSVIAAVLVGSIHVLVSRLAFLGSNAEQQGRRITSDIAFSFAVSLAVSIAVFVAVTRLRGELAWPERYWHWLPYIGIIVALVASGLTVFRSNWQLIIWASIGIAAAWMLVPDWENLTPGRSIYVPLVGLYLATLIWLYQAVARSATAPELLITFAVTSIGIAITIAATVSLKYGLLAAFVTAALAGCFLVNLFVNLEKASIVGSAPCLAILVGSTAFVGFIYPHPPVYELAFVPFAPLALMVSRRTDRRGVFVRIIVLCLAVGSSVAAALFRGEF